MSDPSIIAADPTKSAWVAANAGSGKTYTLANRVTRLLLTDTDPEKILCLTYTKAAAAEMQARLFKQLGEWSMLPNTELTTKVREIGADLGGPEDMKKARRLFAKALETPGGIKILTIHAFCQNLLSRFPLEAGVPTGFTVLDDQSARELIAESRREVLENAASGDAVRAAAVSFLVTQTSELTLTGIIEAALGPDRRKLDRVIEKAAGKNLFETVRAAHGAKDGRDAHTIARDFVEELTADSTLNAIQHWLAGGSDTNVASAESLRKALTMTASVEKYDALRAIFLTAAGEPRKRFAVKKIAAARPELLEAVETIQARLVDAEEARRAAYVASLAEAALTIASAVREAYSRAKSARGVLDYDDLILKSVALLERSDAAAWVLFKLDKGIDHILIDEAQDTSPEQWRIVSALASEFFAGAGADRESRRTIFAVGDEKQSIFSFQGADPAQFDINRNRFHDAAVAAERAFVDQPLTQSRRSVPEVLKVVDEVFRPEDTRAGLTSGGAPILHDAYRKSDRGRVELWPTIKPDEDADPDPYLLPPLDAPRENNPVARLARKIALAIQGWIGKISLPGKDRPVSAGDIMILLRQREPFASAIIRELKQRGIPVAGADRLVLTEQIAVMDLIALGRFVLQPNDDHMLAVVLRSPFGGVSEDDLFALAHGRKTGLWQALTARRHERPSWGEAWAFLDRMRTRADFSPPYEFFADALISQGMRQRLLKRLGPEAADSIDEFLSLCFAFESSNTPSLEGFLHWIEQGGAEVKRDMERGRDEVRVMTVHGAKGLEADIVILPDTARTPRARGSQGGFLYTEDSMLFPVSNDLAPRAVLEAKEAANARMLEEYRRLFYVALTRARDRLIVCGFEGKRKASGVSWYDLAERAVREIGSEVIRDGEAIHVVGDAEDLPATRLETTSVAVTSRPRWLETPAPRDAPAPRLIRPFDAAGLEEPATLSPFSDNARFQRGLLVHALLSNLPEARKDSRREIGLQFLRLRGVSNEEAAMLIGETLGVLDDPRFAAAFADGSRAEVAIVADLPELGAGARVNGRVDRLALGDDRVLIIDYKTNRPPPTRQEDVADLYRTQMALYRAAAQKIFPGRQIVCGLVWTDGPTLMELSNEMLDNELVRIRARLDPPGSGS